MENRRLENIGFTEGEEKAYFALLKLGSSSTGRIAKESGVSRSKLYEILEKLAKKGVVSHFKRNGVSYFRAAPPERILEYLKEKEQSMQKQMESFEKMIPLFDSFIGEKETAMEAEVYEGMEGIKNVRENALKNMKPGDIIYYFGNSASGHEHVLGYWDYWNKRRIQKKIEAHIIYNQDAKSFGERRKKMKYTKIKYLPKKGDTHAWVEIYGDVAVIAIKHKTPMSIVINNKFVAESFKNYFKNLWDFSLN